MRGFDSSLRVRADKLGFVELQQLETFVAVAEAGSITKAATRLHLSQPAVSAQIKSLEETTGLVLFERTTRGMVLSPAGQRLLGRAKATLAARQTLLDEAARLRGRIDGVVRIGLNANVSAHKMHGLVAAAAEAHPELELTLRHGDTAQIVEGLREGRLDLGFHTGTGGLPPDLEGLPVDGFALWLVAPPELADAASGPEGIDWALLANETWICPAAEACCRVAAESLFEQAGFRPRRIIEVDREAASRQLIEGGVGVGMLHDETARAAEAAGGLRRVLEVGPSAVVRLVHLVRRSDEPALAAILDLARSL